MIVIQQALFIGDILIVQIGSTVIDGASAVASKGLIDDYDCPPIDTWFYQASSPEGRLLFAWIPHKFVALANNAALVNSIDCIGWFKNWYPNEHRQLTEYQNKHFPT